MMKHGTLGGYRYHGCRCDLCRRAATQYEQNRMKAKQAALRADLDKKLAARGLA